MWYSAYAQEAAGKAPAAAGQAQQGLPALLQTAFPFIMLVGIFYFLMIRPNQKQEKKRKDMLASLAKGDKVVTSGGICGTVLGLTEKNVVLRVSDEPPVKMEFVRGAVSKVLSREDETKS